MCLLLFFFVGALSKQDTRHFNNARIFKNHKYNLREIHLPTPGEGRRHTYQAIWLYPKNWIPLALVQCLWSAYECRRYETRALLSDLEQCEILIHIRTSVCLNHNRRSQLQGVKWKKSVKRREEEKKEMKKWCCIRLLFVCEICEKIVIFI